MSTPAASVSAPSPRVPLPTFLIHWAAVAALGTSLATGLRIAADAPDARVSLALAGGLPQGDVLFWHLVAGALVLGLAVAYGVFLTRSGLWRRLFARARPVAGGRTGGRDLAGAHRGLYWSAFGLLGLAIATGMVQYLGLAVAPRTAVETLHRAAAWGLLAFALAHVALHWSEGGWRRLAAMLAIRRVLVPAGLLGAGLGAAAVLLVLAGDRLTLATLELSRIAVPPALDGDPTDPAWAGARPIELALAEGSNLPGGETRVAIRGVHDGERAYLLVQWDDPTRSQKHVPLEKTETGWRILQTAYRRADESVYYEDKLALMLARSDPFAALTSVHLGPRPLAGQPGAPGGRGLHYTTDGSILDLWHWKSVRTAAEGQADDNFFGPALRAPTETPRVPDPTSGAWFPRYTAGYRADPPGTFTGYEMNWEYFDESSSQPLRLPKDPDDLADRDPVDPHPAHSDRGTWWMEYNETRPYAEGDDLPPGTLLPSVLAAGPLKGDRGDIRARGTWSAGRWTLELSRKLDTGSDKDVPLTDGTLLWAAVFDHAQTRHAYHLRPVRIRLR